MLKLKIYVSALICRSIHRHIDIEGDRKDGPQNIEILDGTLRNEKTTNNTQFN